MNPKALLPPYLIQVPRQPNHCDCGIFLLQYVETFLMNPDKYLPSLIIVSQFFSTSSFSSFFSSILCPFEKFLGRESEREG